MRLFSKGLYLPDTELQAEPMARAIALAEQHQSELVILDVFRPPKIDSTVSALLGSESDVVAQIAAARRGRIIEQLAQLGAPSGIEVQSIAGSRYLEAIRAVLGSGYDMVIKMADASPWLRHTLASDDLHLLRKCPCAVYLMHPDTNYEQGNVLAAVDIDPDTADSNDTPLNHRILHLGAAAAAFGGGELQVVHAWESAVAGFAAMWANMPQEAEQEARDGEQRRRQDALGHLLKALRDQLDVDTQRLIRPTSHLVEGPAALVIPRQTETLAITTVVMGTVARTGIPGLIMGNTAEDILHQLRCDVVALKPEGFICPVTA